MPVDKSKLEYRNVDAVNRNFRLLCPKFGRLIMEALESIRTDLGFEVELFEGYRSKERQEWLWASGRTRPGKILTNRRPGQSLHEYSLAADLVAKVDGQWCWDEKKVPYEKFLEVYKEHGLTSAAPFELVHVECIGPFKKEELESYVRLHGLEALWARVFP